MIFNLRELTNRFRSWLVLSFQGEASDRGLVPHFFVASGVVLPGDVALVGVSSLCLDAGCLGNMAMPQGLKVCPTKAIYI